LASFGALLVGLGAGDHHNEAQIVLGRGADQVEARLRCFAGFHAIGADTHAKQRIAVLLVDVVPGEVAQREIRKIIRIVLHDVTRELGELAHRHPKVGIRVAFGIGEGRVLKPDLASALGQHLAKRRFIAGNTVGYGDTGIIGGVDNDALDQVRYFHLAMDRGEHGRAVRRRPALAPGVFGNDEGIVELDGAFLEFVENELQRHQLGKACRCDQLVAVLLVKDAVAVRIEQECRGTEV
jgi:hypothetical protein